MPWRGEHAAIIDAVARGIRQGGRIAALAPIALICGVGLGACGGSHSATGSTTVTSRSRTTTTKSVPAAPRSVATVDEVVGEKPDRMRITIYDVRREGP